MNENLATLFSLGSAVMMGIIFPLVRTMYTEMKEQLAELRAEITMIKREMNDHKLDSMRSRFECEKYNNCKP